jgi:predicted trehalose synthase
MSIPWLAALKVVPWSDVISNAPKVAEGAKKLWGAVGRKMPSADSTEVPVSATSLTESEAIAQLDQRLQALGTSVAELHSQMATSSEIIKTLADQNAQLIAMQDNFRSSLRWLTAVSVLLSFAIIGLWLSGRMAI